MDGKVAGLMIAIHIGYGSALHDVMCFFPFFFLSGYGSAGLPDGFEKMPVLVKPCTPVALKHTIDAVLLNGEPEKTQDKPRGAA